MDLESLDSDDSLEKSHDNLVIDLDFSPNELERNLPNLEVGDTITATAESLGRTRRRRHPHKCPHCYAIYYYEARFKQHLLACGSSIRIAQANKVPEVLPIKQKPDESRKRKRQTGIVNTYQCPQCILNFKFRSLFERHLVTHKIVPSKRKEGTSSAVDRAGYFLQRRQLYPCPYCLKIYQDEDEFKEHFLVHEPSPSSVRHDEPQVRPKNLTVKEEGAF